MPVSARKLFTSFFVAQVLDPGIYLMHPGKDGRSTHIFCEWIFRWARGADGCSVLLNLSAFVGYITFFIRHSSQMLQALGYSGPVKIEITLGPILRVKWLHEWQGFLQGEPGSELDEEIAFAVPTTSEALRDKPDGVAMENSGTSFFR